MSNLFGMDVCDLYFLNLLTLHMLIPIIAIPMLPLKFCFGIHVRLRQETPADDRDVLAEVGQCHLLEDQWDGLHAR